MCEQARRPAGSTTGASGGGSTIAEEWDALAGGTRDDLEPTNLNWPGRKGTVSI